MRQFKWNWRREVFEKLIKEMNLERFEKILDLGCAECYLKYLLHTKKYVGVGIRSDITITDGSQNLFEIDVEADLDIRTNWELFNEGEYDLIVASQILEHLHNIRMACEQIKKMDTRYVLIGLPNDMRLDKRILALFGQNPIGINKGAHCRMFDAKLADGFIQYMFPEYDVEEKVNVYTLIGQKYMKDKLKNILANGMPNLFAGEIYYLLRKRRKVRELYCDECGLGICQRQDHKQYWETWKSKGINTSNG